MGNSIFQKEMCMKKRSPPTQINQWREKCRIRLKRSVIIKKTSQDQPQNQTTITKLVTSKTL